MFSTTVSKPKTSGQKVVLVRCNLHGFQFIGEDTKDLVKLLVALVSAGRGAGVTPEQPQSELRPAGLQQLGDGLPASWRSSVTEVWLDQSYYSQSDTGSYCWRTGRRTDTESLTLYSPLTNPWLSVTLLLRVRAFIHTHTHVN